jgi:hypothetical protein
VNVTDLPELMRERCAHDPVPALAERRMAAIERKVSAGRRRRAAGVLAGLVLVAVAATLPAVAGLRADHRRPAPAASTIDGFPVYADGGRLVASASGGYDSGSVSLSAPVGDLGFLITNRCAAIPSDLEIELQIAVNGRDLGRMSCEAAVGGYAGWSPAFYSHWHVTAGQPVTFVFTPKAFRLTLDTSGQTTGRTPTALPAGTFSVAVYRQVAFADYPLPPRPQTLPTLNVSAFGLGGDTGMTTVSSDPHDPLTPKTLTLTLPRHCNTQTLAGCLEMSVAAQTPGEIDIRIDGTLISTARFWDYDGSFAALTVVDTMQSMQPPYRNIHLTPGSTVTVTITPRYLTGGWEFGAATR